MRTDLITIPGVGEKTKQSLTNIGINYVEDLKDRDPEELYLRDYEAKGFREDRCQLYLFRMAVYYAENENNLDEEKLKWWYWKDEEK